MSKPTPPPHPVSHNAQERAQAGEAFRLSGLYSNAIACFGEAIDKATHDYPWAWAHRGAARSSLGALDDAITDLKRALELKGQSYSWAWGQLGETHRLFAKRFLDKGHQAKFDEHIHESIRCFRTAIEQSPVSSWAQAHLGATYALAYLAELPETAHNAAKLKALSAQGMVAFEAATKLNPTYAWALVFQAFLFALMRDSNEVARTKLAEGLLYDSSRRLIVLRGLCELYGYDRPTKSEPHGNDNGAQAILIGWQALQQDPEDLASRYVVAKELKRKHDPSADAAIDDMRFRLKSARSQINMMMAGLDLAEGKLSTDVVKAALNEHLDGDALALVHMDPNYRGLLTKVF